MTAEMFHPNATHILGPFVFADKEIINNEDGSIWILTEQQQDVYLTKYNEIMNKMIDKHGNVVINLLYRREMP